jgi:hypothetical protein
MHANAAGQTEHKSFQNTQRQPIMRAFMRGVQVLAFAIVPKHHLEVG